MSPEQTNNLSHVENYRPQLLSIAYKLLGSVADAEDVVQDALLDVVQKVQQGKEIENMGGYLATATVHTSLNLLKKQRRDQYPGVWLPEPYEWSHTLVEAQLDVPYSFVYLLSELNPKERAVYLLRKSFDLPYADIAEQLDLSESACRKLEQRARKKLVETEKLQIVSLEQKQQLVAAFLQATQQGDVSALTRLLREDIVIYSDGGGKKVAATRPIMGLDRCIKFILGIYQKESSATSVQFRSTSHEIRLHIFQRGQLDTVILLATKSNQIQTVYLQRNPDKLSRLTANK
ncbi:sigma factor-like helix-turn-helix DNA-binding protein [Tunicatimonas pelagia]|uniref:sigma factor-like helix-turn-helix DNA-binding protein n=1 Tax=Tunicatimonas pelagia TaxID=931531 RepID=UPI0026665FEF|nr:sigma factor-like helix-turn-helix DNA-binding protein [Tunicatimonas pelagia]WKN46028.1 sigma factor-like helix-turn-helix DNA-binding protein [Tunicatimonas pelagia]